MGRSLEIIALCSVIRLLTYSTLPDDAVNWNYTIQSGCILIVCNFCVFVNLAPRLIAIWKGEQNKYTQSIKDEMAGYLLDKMNEFSSIRSGNSIISRPSDAYPGGNTLPTITPAPSNTNHGKTPNNLAVERLPVYPESSVSHPSPDDRSRAITEYYSDVDVGVEKK